MRSLSAEQQWQIEILMSLDIWLPPLVLCARCVLADPSLASNVPRRKMRHLMISSFRCTFIHEEIIEGRPNEDLIIKFFWASILRSTSFNILLGKRGLRLRR